MCSTVRSVILLAACGAVASPQASNSLPPGTKIPEFALRDQTDRPRALKDIIGPRGAMLVFYRSADW